LQKLHDIRNTIKGDLIFVGDFNFQLAVGSAKEQNETKVKTIAKISHLTEDPYKVLILESTMTSSKLSHCNDTILIQQSMRKHVQKNGFRAILPQGTPKIFGEFALMRVKDYKRELFTLFTDHFPVSAIFSADDLPVEKRLEEI
jgi:hypothetical protein